jgi:hypothetical protein
VAILGYTPFGNVEMCENLDADDEVFVKPAWKLGDLPQRAVNTAAHARAHAPGLDVDIARPNGRSFTKQCFLNADDGGRVCSRTRLTRRNALD